MDAAIETENMVDVEVGPCWVGKGNFDSDINYTIIVDFVPFLTLQFLQLEIWNCLFSFV
jgi:hypothetical protein